MKKNVILLSLIVLLISCKKEKDILKGEILLKGVDTTNLYHFPDSVSNTIIKKLDSIELIKNSKVNDTSNNYFLKLKKHNLLKSPYVYVYTGPQDKDFKVVFLSMTQHEKIKKFDYKYLNEKRKKVNIALKIKELDKGIFYSDKIIGFEEIDGNTQIYK